MISRRALIGSVASIPFAARAQFVEMDCLLVLAVDVSASMSAPSQELQRRGYEDAIRDPTVIRAIRGGPLGRIGLLFVEWSGRDEQRIVLPWTIISDEASAAAFGLALRNVPVVKWSQTSISGGLLFAASQIAACPYQAPRKVIDVSGDGPNNDGADVGTVRDQLVRSGITINGLPILTPTEPSLLEHYESQVIGGPGAFVMPANGIGEFREGLTRKLILELA